MRSKNSCSKPRHQTIVPTFFLEVPFQLKHCSGALLFFISSNHDTIDMCEAMWKYSSVKFQICFHAVNWWPSRFAPFVGSQRSSRRANARCQANFSGIGDELLLGCPALVDRSRSLFFCCVASSSARSTQVFNDDRKVEGKITTTRHEMLNLFPSIYHCFHV